MTYNPMYSRQRADFVAATEAAVQPLVDEAQAWAEGTLPGGAGTKSAKEWSEESALSAATAEAAAGPTYASTAAGLAATTSGQAFAVDAGGGLVSVYLNSSGTAVLQRTLATTGALAASGGSALVGFLQSGTGATARTVQSKLRDTVSVKDFGAVGAGVTDDTAAIQAALSSGAKTINFGNSGTYLVNGGLTCSTVGVTIDATGATIKLKNSASNKSILTCTGDYSTVIGGTWDCNRSNGNSIGSEYDHWGVSIDCDYGTIKNATAKSSYGAGLLGIGNYLTFQNNTVSDCAHWGIFITALPATHYYGNKAIGNVINSSANTVTSQGILFSSTGNSTGQQRDWVLANNIVTGPQGGSVANRCICLAVRGERGTVSGNVTRYGSMGFSEGGNDTVVTGNVFSELQGSLQYGIEPSGRQTITANYVSSAKRGVNAGNADTVFDGMVISGNTFITTGIAVNISPGGTGTANDLVISGNYLSAVTQCISLVRTCDRPTITGNKMVGNGTGNGVFLNTPSLAPFAFASGNTFRNIVNPLAVFNSAPLRTYTDLFASANNFSGCTTDQWSAVGANVMGGRVSSIGNILIDGTATQNTIDVAAKRIEKWGTGTPEGVVAAGVGSIFHRTDGGAATCLYIKESGTGNTGWVAK